MKKKGNAVLDTLFVIIVLFVFGIIMYSGFSLLDEINGDIQADSEISATAKAEVAEVHSDYPALFDGLVVFILVLLWIMVIVFSFMVDSHPIFFILSIILLVFVLIIAGFIGNAFVEFSEEDGFNTATGNFPMTQFIFSHLIETILVIAFSVVVALFAKNRSGL